MENEGLFKFLASMYPISAAFSAAVENDLVRLSMPKNHILAEPPNVANHVYFILSGFAMSYSYINEKKSIDWLWSAGEIIVSVKNFAERRPSNEFIELAQPCELLCLSHKNLAKLLDSFPEAHYLYRAIMNRHFEQSRERISDMKNLTALQRYNKLTRRASFIEQILSQEQIASYLGIAPQSLSRMKRRNDHP